MNRPTVLRNSAEPEIVIGIALKIFYNADDWIDNSFFLDELDREYDSIGKTRESRTGGQAVAKYKPAVYYGLIDVDSEGKKRRINDFGKRYYEAYNHNDHDEMVDCLISSISNHEFGRNNSAVPESRSRIEPPKVFLVSCLLLSNKLSKTEYAYIIENLANDRDYKKILVEISLARLKGTELHISDYAKNNYKDDKGLKFLSDAGFFDEDKGVKSIKEKYVLKYSDVLSSLTIITDENNNNNNVYMNIFKFNDEPRQQIFYGAPGTGKSHEINVITEGQSVIRTTFHPDSDYSTFVGAYKPTMEDAEVQVVPVIVANGISLDQNNGTYKEKRISYSFIKQAFLKAYLAAWKKFSEGGDSIKPQFLIIEEINRGNCAQIFGDLFQLLDRTDSNYSTYPIVADSDLQKAIATAFSEEDEYIISSDLQIEGTVKGYVSNYGATLSEDVQQGRILLLPPNLYIWATMNTSDQSLFPIDSAFKRRWEWRYIKISNGYERGEDGHYVLTTEKKRIPLGWKVRFGEYECDWWSFVKAINKQIGTTTSSDDKKLGYFFCKPKKGEIYIGEEAFVGKVMFYLWNDVFKDNDTSIFKVDDSPEEASYDVFYTEDESGNSVANTETVKKFIEKLDGVEISLVGIDETTENEGETGKFNFDGTPMSLRDIAKEVVLKFINSNPELSSADSIRDKFEESCQGFGTKVIKTESEYHALDGQISQVKNWQEIILTNGEKLYINTQWRAKNPDDNFIKFIDVVKTNSWGDITPII